MQQDFTEREALAVADLSALAEAIRRGGQPKPIFEAVERVARKAIGFRLFTITCLDAGRMELERLHSTMPDIYPAGSRKAKRGTAWGEHTLRGLKPFRGTTPEDIRAAFDDHTVMTGMGLGSILNIPVAYDGRCVGTMNLTHVEGWYGEADEQTGLLLAAFIAAPLALHQAASASAAAP